jgi:predicted RNA-binding protein with PIN domain
MSLHYLLDGYNILKQIPAFRDLPLEEGRRGFLRWIGEARPQGSVNNQVTVVFDGHPDHFGSVPQGEMRVIFSDGCSADDQIKRMVEENDDRKNCVVVSDDKDVFLYARSLGARVMSVRAFTSKPRGHNPPQDSGGKNISLSGQEKINKEFSKIWLKEKQ